MDEMKIIIWLFPMLFIFHDFEEIIFIQAWLKRNRSYLRKKFHGLSLQLLPHFANITTASFAFGVAEEFLLISLITLVSYVTDWYSLWAGLFVAFTLHLIIHCFQFLIVKKYIPAIITSIICLPICIYISKKTVELISLSTVILYSILGVMIMLVNLYMIHRGMDIFNQWLVRYEQQDDV